MGSINLTLGDPFVREGIAGHIQARAFTGTPRPIQTTFTQSVPHAPLPLGNRSGTKISLTGEGPHRMAVKTDMLPLRHCYLCPIH